jgi:hypothetical protein
MRDRIRQPWNHQTTVDGGLKTNQCLGEDFVASMEEIMGRQILTSSGPKSVAMGVDSQVDPVHDYCGGGGV